MLSEKQVEAVEETATELKRRRENRPAPKARLQTGAKADGVDADRAWARENLRFNGNNPILDIANALRVLERHADFKGRFKYNDMLNKVMDKGAVMLDWRVSELVADIQERFLPEVTVEVVERALIVYANRAMAKKQH